MASLLEVGGAELDVRGMLLLVEVLADLHDLVQVLLLAIDLDGLLVLAGLHIQVGSFTEVARVAFELSLLNQDLRVQVWLISLAVLFCEETLLAHQ